MGLVVEIENYKSIQRAQIDLRPGLSILVGSNGSGKTCLLSALKFLQDMFRTGAAQALARQGGARRVYHRKKNMISFTFIQAYGDRLYRRRKIPCQFVWRVKITQAGAERIATIVDEEVHIIGTYRETAISLFLLRITRPENAAPRMRRELLSPPLFGRDLFSLWEDKAHKTTKKTQLSDETLKRLDRMLNRLKDQPDRACFPFLSSLDKVIAEIHWKFLFLNEYNILPDVARTSTEQLPFARMATNGAGVSEVIDALENKRYNKLDLSKYAELDEFYGYGDYYPSYYRPFYIGQWRARYPFHGRTEDRRESYSDALENISKELSAAVKTITGVSVAIDSTNGRRFVMFRAGENTFYPEEVSDGTIKWLCILVSLFVPFSSVYLLEEPENFLHPWMQQRLVQVMRGQSEKNGTIFLLSSHSATILNAAYPEEILIVKQTDNGTEISEMADLDQIREVLAESEFHLGDLWVSGAIGGVPADE